MAIAGPALPDTIAMLRRLVLAREAELARAQADLVHSRAREASAEAVILHLRLAVEKMRCQLYGRSGEAKKTAAGAPRRRPASTRTHARARR